MKEFLICIALTLTGLCLHTNTTLAQKWTQTSLTTQVLQPAKKPNILINALKELDKYSGDKAQTQSASQYAQDGTIIYEYKIVPFLSKKDEALLTKVRDAFEADKACGFSYIHYPANSGTLVNLTTDPQMQKAIQLRTNLNQELFVLQVRNADNSRLKDVYAIVVDPARPTQGNTYDSNGHFIYSREVVTGKIAILKRRMSSDELQSGLLGDISGGNNFVLGVDTAGTDLNILLTDENELSELTLKELQKLGYTQKDLKRINALRRELQLYKREINEQTYKLTNVGQMDTTLRNMYIKRIQQLNNKAQKTINKLGRLLSK